MIEFTSSVIASLLAAVIFLVIGLFVSEPLKNHIGAIISRFSVSKKGLSGLWKATFIVESNGVRKSYVEIIKLSLFLGMYYGRIAPDDQNYDLLRKVHDKKPLRLRGQIKDDSYFTGIWFHPIETHRFHGAFQLIYELSGEEMRGVWIGMSKSKNRIDSGTWYWERLK